MTTPIGKARGEGNGAGATQGGEEAGASAARLRTETFYKAGEVWRVSHDERDRESRESELFQEIGQLKMELEWLKKSCPVRVTPDGRWSTRSAN